MDERKYHYSKKGEAVAKNTGLHDALNGLETDVTGELTDHMRPPGAVPVQELTAEMLNSAYFEELSDEEQAEVLHNINRFGEVEALSWLVEGSESSDDDLLELPKVESRHSARREDLITLIGASALDFYETQRRSWLDNWEENGFRNKLDAAIFATAASMSGLERRMRDPGGTFGYKTGHNTYRNIFLGATMHGDFRMTQFDTWPQGAVSPTGRRVEFAPEGEKVTIGSYHSTETSMAIQVLRHFYHIHESEEEIRPLLEDINKHIKKEDSPSYMGNFADYGDIDIKKVIEIYKLNKEWWLESAAALDEDGTVLEQFMVSPGDHNVRFEIVSFPEYLSFTQTFGAEGSEEDRRSIDIPNECLSDFLLALYQQTKSGAGRTAPEAIEALLKTAESDCGNPN